MEFRKTDVRRDAADHGAGPISVRLTHLPTGLWVWTSAELLETPWVFQRDERKLWEQLQRVVEAR